MFELVFNADDFKLVVVRVLDYDPESWFLYTVFLVSPYGNLLRVASCRTRAETISTAMRLVSTLHSRDPRRGWSRAVGQFLRSRLD